MYCERERERSFCLVFFVRRQFSNVKIENWIFSESEKERNTTCINEYNNIYCGIEQEEYSCILTRADNYKALFLLLESFLSNPFRPHKYWFIE